MFLGLLRVWISKHSNQSAAQALRSGLLGSKFSMSTGFALDFFTTLSEMFLNLGRSLPQWYCWWKKSCTTWGVWTGAGFLPSTVPRVWILNNANWGLQCCRKSRPQITRPKCSSLGRFWTMRGARVCKKMIMILLIHYKSYIYIYIYIYIYCARYTIYKADLLTCYNSCICISSCNTWIHWSECRRNIFPIASVFLNWLTRAMHGRIILHWWYNDYQWCRYDMCRSANCCTPPPNDNATPPRSLVVVEWVFLANSIRRNSNIALEE